MLQCCMLQCCCCLGLGSALSRCAAGRLQGVFNTAKDVLRRVKEQADGTFAERRLARPPPFALRSRLQPRSLRMR